MAIRKLFVLALMGLFLFCVGCSEEAALTSPGPEAANGPSLIDKDGTETLGAARGTISGDSGSVEGGVGMVDVTTGPIDLDVPDGAAIQQVLTYYDISGTVFVDANSDGVLGAAESGIGNVVLDVTNSQGVVTTVQTNAEGEYLFTGAIGDYNISINLNDHFESFNDDLDASFTPTTALSIPVSRAASEVYFGFVPDAAAILEDLEMGNLDTDGETLRYWKKTFRGALIIERSNRQGHNGRGHGNHHGQGWGHDENFLDGDELRALLATISELYLPEPYQFTEGEELEDAFSLLRQRPRTEDEELLRELFVTELNFVSGLGLVNEQDRVGVLISWGEGLLATPPGAKSADKDRGFDVFNAIQIFSAINTGGGGGVDE